MLVQALFGRSIAILKNTKTPMNVPVSESLDLNIARARIALSLLAMASLYVDPSNGGLFHLDAVALITLLCHLAYSLAMYSVLRRGRATMRLPAISIGLDLFFATAVALLTEGQTSPSYVFFVFAIIAVGVRPSLRLTITVTLSSVALYLAVIGLSAGLTSFYTMRAVYLAIAGYLIGFIGQQRAIFEREVRELESRAERHSIARSLHDGYVQALAAVNLRLETARELLARKRPADALAELTELQHGVTREYDEVRAYIRSLAGVDAEVSRAGAMTGPDPRCQVQANFTASALIGEHVLQIMLEGLRNARRHGQADAVSIGVSLTQDKVLITIVDDGIGFSDSADPPWAIASRVAELGGRLSLSNKESPQIEIEVPAN
jgi:signal transduction histidine kinase